MGEFRALVVDGIVPAKLEGISVVKPAQFKEARAMIQGNLCTNKVEVIAYPVIAGQVVPPVANLDVASVGMTTVLGVQQVRTIETDMGINPVAAAIEASSGKTTPEPTNPNTKPLPNPDGGALTGINNGTQVTGNVQQT